MSHYYFDKISGSYFPSVSTILQATLEEPDGIRQWKLKNKNWKTLLSDSAKIGTLVHYAILNPISDYTLDCGDLPKLSEWPSDTSQKLELSVMMLNELLKKKKMTFLQPRMIESKIINHEEKYAGKFDLCCPVICKEFELNGEKVLFDIKTSARVQNTHLLQLGGYWKGFPKDEKPNRVGIIKITPDARRNPRLEAELHIYTKAQAEMWGAQFLTLARRFHAENMKPKDGIDKVD